MIIDGRALAQKLNEQTAERVKKLSFTPLLCDVVVGDDPASLSYVGIKQRTAEQYGLKFRLEHLPASADATQVIAATREVQTDPNLCGLIVQLPLPKNLPTEQILSAIESGVDVDLINPQTTEAFYSGQPSLVPPTAGAILHILDSLERDLAKAEFVVVGQGDLVGKPTAFLLKQRGLKVQVVTQDSPDRGEIIKQADVLICGAGQPGIITGDMVKEGVIVVDAGTSESEGSITGDVDFESVSPKAALITPVPGGVGPVTVAMLLANVVQTAEKRS